jgi:hypothetical protein
MIIGTGASSRQPRVVVQEVPVLDRAHVLRQSSGRVAADLEQSLGETVRLRPLVPLLTLTPVWWVSILDPCQSR